jgi:hypothetical protein
MQSHRQRLFLLVAILVLLETAWGRSSALAALPKRAVAGRAAGKLEATDLAPTADLQSAADAWNAAAAEANARQFQAVQRALPGNDNTWFVLLFYDKTYAGNTRTKSRRLMLVQGRTMAAYAVFSNCCKGAQSTKKFQYFAAPNLAAAQICYRNVLQYGWQAGYR